MAQGAFCWVYCSLVFFFNAPSIGLMLLGIRSEKQVVFQELDREYLVSKVFWGVCGDELQVFFQMLKKVWRIFQ